MCAHNKSTEWLVWTCGKQRCHTNGKTGADVVQYQLGMQNTGKKNPLLHVLGLYNRLSTNTVNRCTHAFRHLYKYIHTYADAHPATVDFSCVHCWCGTDLFSPLSRNGHSKGGFEKLQQSIYGHYYYHYCHRAHRQVSLAPGSIVPHQHLISVLTYVQFSHFKAPLCPKLRWRFLKRPHTLNHFPWHHLFSGRPCDSLKSCALDICHMTMGSLPPETENLNSLSELIEI